MFVLVPDNDKDTLDLIRDSVTRFEETNHTKLSVYERVLLTIIEIEGYHERIIFSEQACLTNSTDSLIEEIEKYAGLLATSIWETYPIAHYFSCTIAEYNPTQHICYRAITGTLSTSGAKLN